MRLARFAVVSVLVLGALASAVVGVAGAKKRGPAPLAIHSASLVQDGQQLVWTVSTDGPFSAQGLRHDHRQLCLVVDRRHVDHDLCVGTGPKRLALFYHSRHGWHLIHATISRSGSSQLTASFTPSVIGVSYVPVDWQVTSSLRKARIGYPSHPKFLRVHVPKLVGCVPSGSDLVFNGPTNVHDIALSFDDGPWGTPPTTDFINLLAKYHAPGTFFEIGDQISEFDPTGAVEREMLADGDMIGNHTWTHPDMAGLSAAAQTSELTLTNDAIRRATGFEPCLWRPPYGDTNAPLESLARSLGMTTIYWDIDPRDWSLPGTGEIEGNIITNARNGGITEMHFGGGPRYETLDALPDIIDTLRARGYKFVTLTQMLGYRLIYK
jgi:peptidoglycan/xylan/chitin deacetylase (PgdA/CDA1 family)